MADLVACRAIVAVGRHPDEQEPADQIWPAGSQRGGQQGSGGVPDHQRPGRHDGAQRCEVGVDVVGGIRRGR